MKKATYTATIEGATITRSTATRTYSHAWALVHKDGRVSSHHRGFASSEELARKAGGALVRYYPGSRVAVAPATLLEPAPAA